MSPHVDVRVFVQKRPLLKDRVDGHGKHQRPGEAVDTEFPSLFPLPRPRVDAGHEEHNVCGRGNVEDFEAEVPEVYPQSEWRHPEEVEVSGAEDEDVENLGDQRDAFGTPVPVDCPHEDDLRCDVRKIPNDSEDVEYRHLDVQCPTNGSSGRCVLTPMGRAGQRWDQERLDSYM